MLCYNQGKKGKLVSGMSIYDALIGGSLLLYILFRVFLDGKFKPEELNKIVRLIIVLIPVVTVIVMSMSKSYFEIGLAGVIIAIIDIWLIGKNGLKLFTTKSRKTAIHNADM